MNTRVFGTICESPKDSSIHKQVDSALNLSLFSPLYSMHILDKYLTLPDTDMGEIIGAEPVEIQKEPTYHYPNFPNIP